MGSHLLSAVLCSKSLFSANHCHSVVTVTILKEPFLVMYVIQFLKFNAKNSPSGIVPWGGKYVDLELVPNMEPKQREMR